MAITTAAQAIYEINATNLVDGQQIKQLLIDLTAFLETAAVGSVPKAAPGVFGTVEQATATTATGGTDTVTQTNLQNLIASLVAAGIMA